MANILICSSCAILGEEVKSDLFRITGSTIINPAIGICLQMVAAWSKQDPLIFFRDVWPLIVPSVIGASMGAYFMVKVYEPLLLYLKYKDLA